jgi:hypothetical protein
MLKMRPHFRAEKPYLTTDHYFSFRDTAPQFFAPLLEKAKLKGISGPNIFAAHVNNPQPNRE